MTTVRKGDALETSIYDLFKSEIDAGTFFVRSDCCRIARKKGYYSKDRESNIFFDISIEVRDPEAEDYSFLFLIECKNYGHPVPVNDVEEFFIKTQQVAAANSKAILVASNSFDPGGLKFAKSKGMGVARYFEPSTLKWELRRSASAGYGGKGADEGIDFDEALTREDYRSKFLDLYCQTGQRFSASLWDFVESLAVEAGLTPRMLRRIRNPRGRSDNSVPFIEKSQLETAAEAALSAVDQDGLVDLEKLCRDHPTTKDFEIVRSPSLTARSEDPPPLGRVLFDEKRIELFISDDSVSGRDRFTLAHELSHVLLKHGDLMRREYSDENDHEGRTLRIGIDETVPRLEWQANYMAACLLMPRLPLIKDFLYELQRLDIRDKGVGLLYVDRQICNIEHFRAVTGRLMKFYGASRAAVAIRLEGLGLLRDVRQESTMKTVGEALLSGLPMDDLAQQAEL